MTSIDRGNKQFFVFLFKNYLSFEGQIRFQELYELVQDNSISDIDDIFTYEDLYSSQDRRVVDYFINVEKEIMIPISAFPLLFIKKESKMKYCQMSYKEIDIKDVISKVTSYIVELDIKSLFIPPPDILYKIAYQRYNDGGEVKFDYEPAQHLDSGFLYQNFISQPLQPREVWVPGKSIKNNNIFWMLIGKQILSKDPVYPSSDPNKVYERLKLFQEDDSELWRFDVTAFGLQFCKELLIGCSTAIAELYPSSFLTEQTTIFHRILEEYDVLMPNGLKLKPIRGIGLGYYEDLKTIVIMAILNHLDKFSIYGDQGIIADSHHVDEHLRNYSFIIKPDKIKILNKNHFLWGGYSYTDKGVSISKTFSNGLLGAFFSRQHWERKMGLRSLYSSHPELYIRYEKRIALCYENTFGHEFYRGETFRNFYDCGVMATRPLISGVHKLYKVQDLDSPESSLPLDLSFMIPQIVERKRVTPDSIARKFSQKRKSTYRATIPMDDSVYRYTRPRIVYNNKETRVRSPIPGWADVLYASMYNCSTGVITFGLSPDELRLAARRQVYAHNPFSARSRGGYSILTNYRGMHCPSEEMLETAELLANLEVRDLPYATRADLYQSAVEGDDPIYFDTALVSREYFDLKRKNREAFSEYSGISDTEYRDLIYKKLRSTFNNNEEEFPILNQLLRDASVEFPEGGGDLLSDHGAIEGDDDYYMNEADAIIQMM